MNRTSRTLYFVLVLTLILQGLTIPALALETAKTKTTDPSWQAAYWNNKTLSGGPVLNRFETTLNNDWGMGSPDPAIPADGFSARWTRFVDFEAATYRFTAVTDDGMRVWVDDRLIIDQWRDQPATTFTADVALNAGPHYLKVEYYENTAFAVAKLSWQKVSGPAPTPAAPPPAPAPPAPPLGSPAPGPAPSVTWRGEYFNNMTLTGAPVLVRDDAAIDFDWGEGSPAPGVNANGFSVRWTRNVTFAATGRYRFTTTTDDGVRLFIDGNLIIDQWKDLPRTSFSREIPLNAGVHTMRMEYFENGYTASAKLAWEFLDDRPMVGNLITCVPPQPANYAWIRVYTRNGDGTWIRAIAKGVGSVVPSGYLKIDGLAVDPYRYGEKGQPYWIEQWVNNVMVKSTGNTDRGRGGVPHLSRIGTITPRGNVGSDRW